MATMSHVGPFQALAVALILAQLSMQAGAQDVSSMTVAELRDRLAAAEVVEDDVVSDEPSRLHAIYREYAARATKEELVAACGHDRPVLRVYAMQGLVDNGYTDVLAEVMGRHLADTEKTWAHTGCIRYESMAGDMMFEAARPKLPAGPLLDLAERLVKETSPLYAREWALRNLRFRDGMLHVIRKLAEDGDAPAAIALARYGIGSDAAILIEHLRRPEPFDENCQFLAAEIHRAPALLPELIALEGAARARIRRDNPSRLGAWLQAITAHRGEQAAGFLLQLVRSRPVPAAEEFKAKDFAATIRAAIAAHPDPVFDPVLTALDHR